MSNKRPKVSVIVPVYNVEKYIRKCLDSILSQTYKNIELIIVNDCSPGNIVDIVNDEYDDDRVQLVNLSKNQGLFRARMAGYEKSVGDYLVFVDGDDNISCDYIRTLVEVAEKNSSDIVLAETVIEEEDGRKFIYNLANDLSFDYLNGRDAFLSFMDQQGDNYMWHIVHSKMFRKSLFDSVSSFYNKINDHIIMCEDIIYSFPLWHRAERVDRARTAYYYYLSNGSSSTKNNSINNLRKSISDITKSFKYVDDYLTKNKASKEIKIKYDYWVNSYAKMWKDRIDWHIKNREDREALLDDIKNFSKDKRMNFKDVEASEFYKLQTEFNPALENDLKKKIIDKNIEIVSFDIFDTLILRPLYEPKDLFRLMDNNFSHIDKKPRTFEFSEMRVESEKLARKTFSDQEDIGIDQIYQILSELYKVEPSTTEKMKTLEVEYEIRLCYQRKTAKELFDLALFLGKKIVISSDMYLPKSAIKTILVNNGYTGYSKVYLSNDLGLTKATGNMFKYITDDLNIDPEKILHIGDNYTSDYKNALSSGLKATMLPRAMEAMNSHTEYFGAPLLDRVLEMDKKSYCMENLGISVVCALTANSFFDNPFSSFNKDSNFNGSPSFIGYFALGMQMFGMVDWMARDLTRKDVQKVVFLARDGYLPKKIFDKFSNELNLGVESDYFHTSRKATIPLVLSLNNNLADLSSFGILRNGNNKNLSPLIPFAKNPDLVENASYKGLDIRTVNEIAENINFEKLKIYVDGFTKEFRSSFSNKTAVFDIGYSGKPSAIFRDIFGVNLETYFMYSNTDEPVRRLGERVNVFGRFKSLGLRELIISEQTPSCVGYQFDNKKKSMRPIFDDNFRITYYERYVISTMQKKALDMIDDLFSFFGDKIDQLYWGDFNLVSMPIDSFFERPTRFDRILYSGLKHEDDIGVGGDVNVLEEFYNNTSTKKSNIQEVDIDSMSRLKRLFFYCVFNRQGLYSKIKQKLPRIYEVIKSVRRRIKNN